MKTELPTLVLDEKTAQSVVSLRGSKDWENVLEYMQAWKDLLVESLLVCDSDLDSFLKGSTATAGMFLLLDKAAGLYFESQSVEE